MNEKLPAMSSERAAQLRHILETADSFAFLDSLVQSSVRNRTATHSEFADLPPLKRKLILVRAFYLSTETGDFRKFLDEQVCGAFVADLKSICSETGAAHAIRLIDQVETAFGEPVPLDSDLRFEMVETLEDCFGDRWFRQLNEEYRASGENVAELLRSHIQANQDRLAPELSA